MRYLAQMVAVLGVVLAISASPALAEKVLYSSAFWERASVDVEGVWWVVEDDRSDEGGRELVLNSDFSTQNARMLRVGLSTKQAGEIKKPDLAQVVEIGSIEARGTQRVAIDRDVDLSAYKSVVVYDRELSRVYSSSPLGAGEVVAVGEPWKKKTYGVRGSYEIVRVDGALELRMHEDFRTSKGPDLKLALSVHGAEEVANRTAFDGSELRIGLLESVKGAQDYRIDGDADLSAYKSVIIHCEEYTKLWGASAIRGVSVPERDDGGQSGGSSRG